MKKFFIFFLLLCVLGTAALFLPYRAWLEKRLELILEVKGFENVSLTISSLGFNSASLENVSVGREEKLNLKNIILEYSLPDLWEGNLRDLAVDGVSIDMKQNDGRWIITGLEGWDKKPEANISEPLTVPITPQQMTRVPFERIKLENSLLNIAFKSGELSLPLNLTWQKAPRSEFIYKGNNLGFRLNSLKITAGNLTFDAYIDEEGKKWFGPWALDNMTIAGASIPIPVMSGAGDAMLDEERSEIKGKVQSADKLWRAEFNMTHNFTVSEKSSLNIIEAGMPWKEGRIDVRNINVPLEGENPIKVTLQLKSVSIQELMQSLTGDRVSATGKVSGTLPLIIGRDGKITVLPGNLKSEGPGTISMPPDAIPGNNEQVELVRQILEDLRYTGLTIAIKNNEAGHLGVLMTFEGNNPAVYKGRPVKLNVNLTGDVLEFLQQNILLLTNPEQFLQQGHDEKN